MIYPSVHYYSARHRGPKEPEELNSVLTSIKHDILFFDNKITDSINNLREDLEIHQDGAENINNTNILYGKINHITNLISVLRSVKK